MVPQAVHFGDFALDLRAGELRKNGIRIRLQEQPLQILAMLLERPGEVVLRDEICRRLWPNDTVVEYSHSINAAVQRLRDALGDSAAKPRYVETVARRGYRFIGEIERLDEAPGEPSAPRAAEPSAAPGDDLSGQTILDYRVLEKLGSGGMGVVYRAEDLKLGRQVALKFLSDSDGDPAQGALERFAREARAASALSHPNICTIYGLREHGGRPVIVMELVEGETLAERLADGPLPVAEALAVAVQLAGALEAAHGKGIVHRDLKPANIMLTRSGVKVLDFGLAQVIPIGPETATQVTREGAIVGTLRYMSPEQAQGKTCDARSDLFSFGLVLYELLTGQAAFAADSPAGVIGAILHAEPAPVRAVQPAVPVAVERIVRRCLAKSPEDRFPSARDLKRELERARESPRRWQLPLARLAAACIVALALAAVWYGWVHWRPASKLAAKDTVLLAEFANKTGDPVFDGTLGQGLEVQLQQSPFLAILPQSRIQETLRLMGRPPETRLTGQVARELCQRAASAAVIDGSIARVGTQYSLTLEAASCATGELLATTEALAATKDDVLKALGKASSALRERLGESLATVRKLDVPLEQATTPSLEALHAYSVGREAFIVKADGPGAVALFEQAIRLDANFAMAYLSLGEDYIGLGEAKAAAENIRKAYQLRDSVSEVEKLAIESRYFRTVLGDLVKARRGYELWSRLYPRDYIPLHEMASIDYDLGRYEEALEELRRADRLGANPANLMMVYVLLNRLPEARAVAERARGKNLDSRFLHGNQYIIAFLEGDTAGMDREVAWAEGKSGAEDMLLGNASDTAAYFGQLAKARDLLRRAVASARHEDDPETAAGYQADAALWEGLCGNRANGERLAREAAAVPAERDVQFQEALAFAVAGDAARAGAIAEELNRRFPSDTIVQFLYLPTLRGEIALSGGRAAEAIHALADAALYELGYPGGLYPVYVRGQAYLAAGEGSQAAAEFARILAHRGVVSNEPMGALARLGLARAYARLGDAPKARAAYRDFLTLWKDADPDVPEGAAARAENSKLAGL